jgi:Tfp pilus assembly protein PilE
MKGFTLIETLMYCALFSLIALGAFTSIAALAQSSERIHSDVVLIEEASFLADHLQARIEKTGAVPTAADVLVTNAVRVTSSSFTHTHPTRDTPEHIYFAFTLSGIGTHTTHTITIHRVVYLTP